MKTKVKKQFKCKLKTKLTILILLLISIPLIALGAVSYKKISTTMQSTVEGQLKELQKKADESINDKIDSVSKYIEVISLDDDIAQSALRTDDKIKNDAFEYISQLQKSNSNEIESITIVDTNCKGVFSNTDINMNIDFSDRDYVKKALKGTPSQSDVIISKITGNPVITIAYPLKHEDKITGVVIGFINFKNISKYAGEINIGKKGYAYMVNKDGVLIYHPDAKKILKENASNTNNKDLKALVEQMKAGKAGQGYYDNNGKKLVMFTPVKVGSLAITADYSEYMHSATVIKRFTIILSLAFIAIAVAIAYLLANKNIIKPIIYLEKLMSMAGNGDLTVNANIKTGDEIQDLGVAFNQMIAHQHNMIGHITKSSEDLAATSEEMAASSEEISASTEEITQNIEEVTLNAEKQNKAIVETSEVLVQLSSLVQLAQSKANLTKKNSSETMNTAQQGRAMVKDTVNAINSISTSAAETSDVLMSVDELSKKVGGIINTINSISQQTNLLALNAAIEAARAGEHGKGFSVVADEVRKLSEESNVGATTIAQLINEMVAQISKAVESMNNSKQVIQKGVDVINQTDKKFITIINSVEQITDDIYKIVDITKDEVANSDQIVKLIDDVATVAETTLANCQQVTASAEEQSSATETLAATAEESSAMAMSLNNLVEKFKI